MNKVLIVDENRDFLVGIKQKLDRLHQFEIMTAMDGADAIELLSRHAISVLVTDISIPKLDGIELLAYMTQHHPLTPCVVMSELAKPWYHEQKEEQKVLYHLEKPFELWALTSAVIVALNLRDEGLTYKGISMRSLLPLIEMAQKTCRMQVSSQDKGKGYLYFDHGKLIDAHYKNMTSEKAAYEISQWERICIKFNELPQRRTRTRVKTAIMDFAGATWHRDPETMPDDVLDLAPEDAIVPQPIEPDNIQTVLDNYLSELKATRGYMAVCVLNLKGELLASNSMDSNVNLDQIRSGVLGVFAASKSSAEQAGFGELRSITLHTQNANILIVSSDNEDVNSFLIVALTKPDGNWFYLKVRLENLFNQLANMYS